MSDKMKKEISDATYSEFIACFIRMLKQEDLAKIREELDKEDRVFPLISEGDDE